MSNLRDDLATAMLSSKPALCMHAAIKSLIAAGVERDVVAAELEQLRRIVSDEEEDVILEALDYLAGWCHPGMKI